MSLKFTILSLLLACSACAQPTSVQPATAKEIKSVPKVYALTDFLQEDDRLTALVDSVFETLDDTAKVAQLLMPAIGPYGEEATTIRNLVASRKIGGILLLNGTKSEFTNWVKEFNAMNARLNNLPFLYSADAEPTLFNRKIRNTTPVKKAAEMTSIEEVRDATAIISEELKAIGINYNFSPVVDMSTNKTVGYRGFGKDPENIIPWSIAFIEHTQNANIIATAKHFPGHGLVSGDTHKSLQVIDGELQEIKNYPPLIDAGVLSIMIGHLAVENNERYATDGQPATISKTIVTELLIEEMGFKGLIVTDAMNMGGVTSFKNAELKAVEAGCDLVLMPKDCDAAFATIYNAYTDDEAFFTARADESIKKIIRMKICLGLIAYR